VYNESSEQNYVAELGEGEGGGRGGRGGGGGGGEWRPGVKVGKVNIVGRR